MRSKGAQDLGALSYIEIKGSPDSRGFENKRNIWFHISPNESFRAHRFREMEGCWEEGHFCNFPKIPL